MNDTQELLKRIDDFNTSYKASGLKKPSFRITPHEQMLLTYFLSNSVLAYKPEFYGDLPKFFGCSFELVGKPVLFNGEHIRSDSGIDIKWEPKDE